MTKIQSHLKSIIASILGLVFIFSIIQTVPIVRADEQTIPPDRTPADRTQPISARFGYGNTNNDTDIENAQISLKIEGEGFEFVPTAFSDLYYPALGAQAPVKAECGSPQTDILIYPILSTLLVNNTFTYSPQSSKNTDTAGGISSPGTLPAKNTGCISVQIKVKSGAIAGQKAVVTYNPDAGNSPSYQPVNKPSPSILNLTVGAAANPVTPVTPPVASSSSSSKSTAPATQATPTSGTLSLSGKAGETKSVSNPLKNISKIEVTLDKDASGDITYKDLDNTGSCTNTVSGSRIVSKGFTYGFDKSLIKTMKITFTAPAGYTDVKAFSCSSPAVETQITALGNNTYTATIPASSTFVVTGASTTTRTGGLETGIYIIAASTIAGTAVVWLKTRRKLLKVTLSDKK